MIHEFKGFLTKSNALALAVGVIIGGATGKVVTSIVEDLLMPVISLIIPSGDWKEAQLVLKTAIDSKGKVTVNAVQYGHFLGSVVDFLFIAIVVFLIMKAILRPEPAPPTAPTKICPECLESIPELAIRCRYCCSIQQ